MRRPSKNSPPKLYPDSQRLIALARETVNAASRLEKRVWEHSMDAVIQKLLKTGRQDALDAALDHLFKDEVNAYDALLQTIEAASESCEIELDGVLYDVLLVAAPVLAWTRFVIPHGPIPADIQQALTNQLTAHVLAPNARTFIAPQLFSIDQLPYSHSQTAAVTRHLAKNALKGAAYRPLQTMQETPPFLADTRYLLVAVAAPAGEPLFCWQTAQNPLAAAELRDAALSAWQAQGGQSMARLLPGCGVELMLPESFFAACRKADVRIRPASIRAAVHYLTQALSLEPSGLRAVVAPFGEMSSATPASEFRVGFATKDSSDIIYGIVWPLYGQEEAGDDYDVGNIISDEEPAAAGSTGKQQNAIDEILATLQEQGVVCEKRHNERFPLEYCDDCGAPLFADITGELVHAEMPEDAPQGVARLH
ncbi:MAG: hypothetical protein H6R04_1626 [Burkholderiaceae bacterium]|nr:hypothetical protein [Burkholderiaceae bacterium]